MLPTPRTGCGLRHCDECSGLSTSSATGPTRRLGPCVRATQVIGCRLLPSNYGGTGAILDRLLHALCDAARSRGYDVLTFSVGTDDEEIAVFDELLQRNAVDGFVLANTHHFDFRPDWLLRQGAPFVAFGRPWGVAGPRHSWVDVDGAAGTADAVDHLAGLGHTRIGFLGFPAGQGMGDDRYQGWCRAMKSLGQPTEGLLGRAEDGLTSGNALAEQMLSLADPPTALVCATDAMAVGALRAIEDRGLRAGRDISVVGFDDSPIASVLRPSLSTVHQPIEDVAHKLIEVLLSEIAGTRRRPARLLLVPRLVARESSGPNTAVAPRSRAAVGVAPKSAVRAPTRASRQA